MAIGTQGFANIYPRWMKIRTDPSSNGQRFFSCFAESFDTLQAEKVMLSKMFKLFAERLGVPNIYWIDLEEEDRIPVDKWINYTFPTLVGTLSDGSTIDINRVEDTANFINNVPTRVVSFGNEEVVPVTWSSSVPDTYNEIKVPCRLGITVTGSKHYKKRKQDRAFPGYHMIEIKGYDQNRKHVVESIYVRDDGTFKTIRIYSELLSVTHDGFSGSVTIYPEEMYIADLMDPFHTGVSINKTRPLYLRRFEEPNGQIGLELFIRNYLNGNSYRNFNKVDVYEEEDLEEILDSQMMLDENGDIYSVVDFTISPIDSRIWCLSSDGRVHVHNNTVTEFSVPPENENNTNTIDIHPDIRRVPYNEDVAIWTFFRALRGPLIELKIRRIDPDGNETYLQSDKTTWSSTEYAFPGNKDETIELLPEDTHDTIRFITTIDKLGEWNFYCDATIGVRGSSNITETSKAGILCSSNTAEKSYSLGLSNVSKIYFSHDNRLTVVTDLTNSSAVENYFNLYNDVYMADIRNQRLLLREDYEEVEVTYV